MSTAAHPVAPEELMAFLDGELPTAQAHSVSDHLKQCADCSNLAAQLGETQNRLASWNVELLPAHAEAAIRQSAEQHGSHLKNFLPRWILETRSGFGWKPLLALSLVTIAALILTSHAGQSPRLAHYAASHTISEVGGVAGYPGAIGGSGQPITDQQSRALSKQVVTLNSPGIAADSNGLLHGLGDHTTNSSVIDAMIARTASLSIMVKDFAASRLSLDSILVRHHGHTAQLNASTSENAQRSITASLRVPANELTATLAELKSLGHVETESQSGEEVTQQHADLVARLKNSRETEQRLQAILLQRAGKIADVLAVEQEIARVRGEIEQMEAEQNSIEHRVNFATIELQISEEYKAQLNNSSPSASTRIHNSVVAGYKGAAETLLGFVLFFAESGPTLLIWLVIILIPALLLVRRFRRAAAAF
ncbi:MAG TPA: DUF4349 domain-containing protein [Methylomirabilota bacterium]|nr:DUF4349 domain-containing protein [Methylomirabilota bacterium]